MGQMDYILTEFVSKMPLLQIHEMCQVVDKILFSATRTCSYLPTSKKATSSRSKKFFPHLSRRCYPQNLGLFKKIKVVSRRYRNNTPTKLTVFCLTDLIFFQGTTITFLLIKFDDFPLFVQLEKYFTARRNTYL